MNIKDQKFYDSVESKVGNIPRMIEVFQDEAFITSKLKKYPDSIIFRDENLWSNPTFLIKSFNHGASKLSCLNTPYFFNNKTAIKIILEDYPQQLHKFNLQFFHNNESLILALDIFLQAKANNKFVNEHFKDYLLCHKLIQSSFHQQHKNEFFAKTFKLDTVNDLNFFLNYFYETLSVKESERLMKEDLSSHIASNQPSRNKQIKF